MNKMVLFWILLAVAPPTAASQEADRPFEAVASVLQHPRCQNCHIATDRPLIGDPGQPHPMNVQRGADGHGTPVMRCGNCHQTSNAVRPHGPPGAPNWHLPPADMPMVFQDLSDLDLCRMLTDPRQNGGRTPAQLLEHVRQDPLVLWGWAPGDGRSRPPLSHETFVEQFTRWVQDDASCHDLSGEAR